MPSKQIAKKTGTNAPVDPRIASQIGSPAQPSASGTVAAPDNAILRQLWKDPVTRICTMVVFACTFWQVFALGFYLDDWTFIRMMDISGPPFSAARWHEARAQTLSRPGETPLWFVLTSIFGSETILWHLALLAANILLGIVLFHIVRRLADGTGNLRILYLGVLLWFVLPWNATFHFWPTDVPILLLLTVFLACFLVMLSRWQHNAWLFWLPAAAYLWCCVGYEAVYFQWLTVSLFGLTLVMEKRLSMRSFALGIAPFVIAQILAVAWVSLAFRNKLTENQIVPHWRELFLRNAWRVPFEIDLSASDTKWVFVA